MKFDIARAWKDENYRQSLDEEQLSMLPANPAGELTDEDLAAVAGGFGPGFGPGFGGFGGFGAVAPAGVAPVAVAPVGVGFTHTRNESVAVICEINIFSLSVISNIAILGSVTQVCIKG